MDRLAEIQAGFADTRAKRAGAFAERMAEARAKQTTRSVHTRGLLAMVDVGWVVWSWDDDRLDARRYTDGYPQGGIILEVTGTGGYVSDDGEIIDPHRAFRVLDHTRTKPYLQYHVLGEANVNPDAVEMWERRRVWRTVGVLAEALVAGGTKDMVRNEPTWRQLVADIARLARSTVEGAGL